MITEDLQRSVLHRYVAERALTELPTTIGFTEPSTSSPVTLAHELNQAIEDAARSSVLLNSRYHVDEVKGAVAWLSEHAEHSIRASAVRPPYLIDQCAFHLLRCLHTAQICVDVLQTAIRADGES